MCFASSIVESHKKLFIAPTPGVTAGPSFAGVRGLSIKATEKSARVSVEKMSRSKSRLHTEICGDCGAADPSWASINRGILLCDDCCSVHRSLGRHISMIKSLRQGCWEPSILNFVNSINAHGANSVWEHHLLDVTTSVGVSGNTKNNIRHRKPSPKDPLHPTKSDFIKAKHVNLAFVLKPNLQDDDITNSGESFEHELSKQLHASVRTSNLETSLRLLVQGANPNFFHEEKRSTPLHVAAKFGQASQIELLIVYGSDINAIDGNGLTPLEVAKANNHNTIAERLLDALYEVTDRIIMFLGGKKPDHAAGRHLIIPESSMGLISEELKIARGRLQLVPNKMFEELVMDLYDEVDRRENEAIWSTSALSAENVTVPFLPANPFLSATRNQGRQKLARFSHKEFAGLLTDVLIDARRRQNMANLRPMENNTPSLPFYSQTATGMTSYNNEHDPYLSDDEPIYDPVASDDDYTMVVPIAQQESHHEMETLRKQLNEYKFEINQLKTVVQKLSSENSELKSKFSNVSQTASNTSVYDEPLRIDLNGSDSNDRESLSLPEGCSGCGGGGSNVAGGDDTISGGGGISGSACDTNLSSASSSTTNSNQSTIKRPASMYERRLGPGAKTNDICRTTTSMYQMVADRPFGEEVKHRTDVVTRRLKELILIIQLETPKGEDLISCAERIHVAVTELIATFATANNCSEVIKETLKQLTRYNMHVQHECEYLQAAYKTDGEANIEKFINEMRDCAYYIASATKTLVMQFD